ncbi:MAG: elongation factor P [Parcubacteria group bacterium]|nr:elongation factor P [Parcubacteria group bacterium]
MLSYTELKKGLVIVIDGQPYEILEAGFLRMQQRKAVMQTKLKNLLNGKVIDRNFQSSEEIEEADMDKIEAVFIYTRSLPTGQEYWFHEAGNPKNRFKLTTDILGEAAQFLKPNTAVTALTFRGNIINIRMPIKIDMKVTESPPAVRGDTAQGGTKTVTLESGAKINVPLFINEGDIVKVNTETGDYVERVEKA